MKYPYRRLRGHSKLAVSTLSIKSRRPWYWWLAALGLCGGVGYLIAYWQFGLADLNGLNQRLVRAQAQNEVLQVALVQQERQLQIERVAQETLTKELAQLQQESTTLKEDVAFYKNIMNTPAELGKLKLQSFTVSKSAQPDQYDYDIMLVQPGKNSKELSGSLRLVIRAAGTEAVATTAINLNFKYYQRVTGSLKVPHALHAGTAELTFTEAGAKKPGLTQQLTLAD